MYTVQGEYCDCKPPHQGHIVGISGDGLIIGICNLYVSDAPSKLMAMSEVNPGQAMNWEENAWFSLISPFHNIKIILNSGTKAFIEVAKWETETLPLR